MARNIRPLPSRLKGFSFNARRANSMKIIVPTNRNIKLLSPVSLSVALSAENLSSSLYVEL